MHYELWDMETRNLAGEYLSETAALSALREIIAAYGRAWVADWELARTDEQGETTLVLAGAELTARALGETLAGA